jgi:hypothetical protein
MLPLRHPDFCSRPFVRIPEACKTEKKKRKLRQERSSDEMEIRSESPPALKQIGDSSPNAQKKYAASRDDETEEASFFVAKVSPLNGKENSSKPKNLRTVLALSVLLLLLTRRMNTVLLPASERIAATKIQKTTKRSTKKITRQE